MKIRVTQGSYGKKQPEKAPQNNKKTVNMAMQLAALNKVRFTQEQAVAASNMEFYGVICQGEKNIEFYFFDDPVMKPDGIEMKYILAQGDMCMFKMAGGGQIMFAGRTTENNAFRIIAKAKIDGKEVDFSKCRTEGGRIVIAFKDGTEEIF